MNEKVALNVLGITYNRTHPETCTSTAYCYQAGRGSIYYGFHTAGCSTTPSYT